MEALLFALIIVRNAYRRHEAFVTEPDKFQSFDLQALRHLYNAKDPSDRQESYLALSVS
jgi:hypothetical protein